MTTDYVDLVEFIVKNLVDKPDAVVVEGHQGRGRSETVEIRLDPVDIGRVIGKGGRNIEAIRALVKASAIKEHHRVNVEVIAEDDEPGGRYAEPDAEAGAAEAPAEYAPHAADKGEPEAVES
jgi:predicted RNA-binding protein YlqC (UPF0109 family)